MRAKVFITLITLIIIFPLQVMRGQSCQVAGFPDGTPSLGGNPVITTTFNTNVGGPSPCAPKSVLWTLVVESVDYGPIFNRTSDTSKIYFQINWGDGTVDTVKANWYNHTATCIFDQQWKSSKLHVYVPGQPECVYRASASLLILGLPICTETTVQKVVTIWDTDNQRYGHLEVNDIEQGLNHVYICAGN